MKEDGDIAAAATMTLSLSFDHRVADGADAARFLKLIKDGLEDPFRLLL